MDLHCQPVPTVPQQACAVHEHTFPTAHSPQHRHHLTASKHPTQIYTCILHLPRMGKILVPFFFLLSPTKGLIHIYGFINDQNHSSISRPALSLEAQIPTSRIVSVCQIRFPSLTLLMRCLTVLLVLTSPPSSLPGPEEINV